MHFAVFDEKNFFGFVDLHFLLEKKCFCLNVFARSTYMTNVLKLKTLWKFLHVILESNVVRIT